MTVGYSLFYYANSLGIFPGSKQWTEVCFQWWQFATKFNSVGQWNNFSLLTSGRRQIDERSHGAGKREAETVWGVTATLAGTDAADGGN